MRSGARVTGRSPAAPVFAALESAVFAMLELSVLASEPPSLRVLGSRAASDFRSSRRSPPSSLRADEITVPLPLPST